MGGWLALEKYILSKFRGHKLGHGGKEYIFTYVSILHFEAPSTYFGPLSRRPPPLNRPLYPLQGIFPL